MTTRLIASLLSGIVFASAAGAQPANPPLNTVPSTLDMLGSVPEHFVWLRTNLQVAQDPIDRNLVFFDDTGRVLGHATLPTDFKIGKVLPDRDQIRLIEESEASEVVVPRTVDPAQVGSLAASPIVGFRSVGGEQLLRRGRNRITLQQGARTGAGRIELFSKAGGMLADAYGIGTDSAGNRYIVTEEIVSSKPKLKVRVFAQRFDRRGRLTGIAPIPIDEMDVVPRGFAAVTASGMLRVLVPKQNSVIVREIFFQNLGPRTSRSRGTLSAPRQFSVETNVVTTNGAGIFKEHLKAKSRAVREPLPRITRAEILGASRAYLSVNWVMGADNFSKSGIENACIVTEWKHWMRPRHFGRSMIGQTIGPMPYRWGGADTPASFKRRIEEGALAGDICTCRDDRYNQCVVEEAAGVDCSGFVSRAWGIPKRGTTGLLDVATPVSSLSSMRPGDALNWPGHHVRLFVNRAPGAAVVFNVLESATRADCEGVCERTYRASEMNQYRPIGFRGAVDSETRERARNR
jgi:hypothetical protein